MAETVILGAGISGLAFFDNFRDKSNTLVIEKNSELGGYTRTINIDRFRFDYTGHFLHINKYKHPSDIGSNGFKYANKWHQIKKESKVYIDNNFCNAPYQYSFGQLGEQHARKAIKSFKERKNIQKNESLQAFFESNFGKYMCDKFFVPYNEKLFGKSLKELSKKQVSRFFPTPDEQLIKNQLSEEEIIPRKTYNSLFWYPKEGGIDLLLKHFEQPLNRIIAKPLKINPEKKVITLSNNKEVNYNNLISSIPLKELLSLCENHSSYPNLNLSASSQQVVHIGTKQSIKVLANNAWIYIPDPSTPIYRIGNYAFASEFMKSSEGGMSLYVELSGNCKDPLNETIRYLREHFGLNQLHIEATTISKLNPAYVHFNNGEKDIINMILSDFKEHSIYSIGRYGSWDYVSMEDCIVSANSLAKELE